MKKILMAVVLFTQSFFLYSEDKIESAESVYTVYLIRHAEKDTHYLNKKNPPLNSCGIERANQVSHFFNNITLEEIYSTYYKRTNSTAAPIAKTKNIEVKHYNPSKLKTFYTQIIQKKVNTLIVGHSNTTNVLAGLLSKTKLDQIPENVYNLIYQVTIFNGVTQLQIFQQPDVCLNKK